MLALTGTTGKIGGATLSALLNQTLIPPSNLVICTSSSPSSPQFTQYRNLGIHIRYSNYDDPSSMIQAFSGCTKLFLVSTPKISLDFHDAEEGKGREGQHFAAIDAAVKAGVRWIYYTSLGFWGESAAGVMRAHLRTEKYLRGLDVKWTSIREGLYDESWPLYFGYYEGLSADEREEVVIAGDGRIAWSSVADLGLASALVVVEEEGKWEGKTVYLSSLETRSLKEIAGIVSDIRGKKVGVKVVSEKEYVDYYVEKGRDRASVEWWVSTYEALKKGECDIKDPTFTKLLEERGIQPKPIEETIREMLSN